MRLLKERCPRCGGNVRYDPLEENPYECLACNRPYEIVLKEIVPLPDNLTSTVGTLPRHRFNKEFARI